MALGLSARFFCFIFLIDLVGCVDTQIVPPSTVVFWDLSRPAATPRALGLIGAMASVPVLAHAPLRVLVARKVRKWIDSIAQGSLPAILLALALALGLDLLGGDVGLARVGLVQPNAALAGKTTTTTLRL